MRARSSNWIEQGTPKPKVASSILAGRTTTFYLWRLLRLIAAPNGLSRPCVSS